MDEYVQIIKSERENVESIEQLKGTTDATILLVNKRFVYKFTKDNIKEIISWYQHNSLFSPRVVTVGSNYFAYEYILGNKLVTRDHLFAFINYYQPLQVEKIDYQTQMQTSYLENCQYLQIEPIALKRLTNLNCYKLHGDLGLHNLVVNDLGMKFIDPEPITGPREIDIIQLYLSNPKIIALCTKLELFAMLSIGFEDFLQLYEQLFVERMVRCSFHHPGDLPFYQKLHYDNRTMKKGVL